MSPFCRRIAQALALDETGEFYDRLLKKQSEVLSRLTSRNQQRQLMLANRVSKRTNGQLLPEAEKTDLPS